MGDVNQTPRDGGGAGVETRRQIGRLEAALFGADPEPVRVGRYRIVRKIGAGAMGTVYVAEDPELGRLVAVKVLRESWAPESATVPPTRGEAARLQREARALARLSHPNIVTVIDAGVVEGAPWVAMELVEGGTLRQWCERNPAGSRARLRAVIDFARQAAQGLEAAHGCGLVHRDFKPANVLIDGAGRLRVADFGLVRQASDPERIDTTRVTSPADDRSATGSVVGTPAYMSPEQFRGAADARSDQFSWAVTFFEALAGARPFAGRSAAELLSAIEDAALADPPGAREVPAPIRRVLLRALQAEPDDRYPSMRAAATALRRAAAPRRRRVLAAAGLAGVAALALGLAWRPQHDCRAPARAIDGAWNADRSAQMEHALGATGDVGDHAARQVRPQLDAYAERWSNARAQLCRASASGSLDAEHAERRLACLGRGLAAVRRVVTTLSSGNDDAAVFALEIVETLPEIDACGLADAAPDAEASRLAAQLDDVETATHRQAYSEALVLLAAPLAQAQGQGRRELLARALVLRAEAREAMADLAGAEDDYRAAFFEAQAAGADGLAFRASTRLAFLLAELLHRVSDADVWLQHAEAVLQRFGDDPFRQGELAAKRGVVDFRAGRTHESVRHNREALALFERAPEATDRDLAVRHLNLGNALRVVGKLEESNVSLQHALERYIVAYGSEHPQTAGAHSALCQGLATAGLVDEADPHCRRCLELREASRFVPKAELAIAYANMGFVRGVALDHEEAAKFTRKALELSQQALAHDHPRIANLQQNLGMSLTKLGRSEEGLSLLRVALEGRRAKLGADHPDFAVSAMNVAISINAEGEHAEARRMLAEALAVLDATMAADSAEVVTAQSQLALATMLDGDPARALQVSTAALDRIAGGEPNTTFWGWVFYTHALCLRALQRESEAKAFAEKALLHANVELAADVRAEFG